MLHGRRIAVVIPAHDESERIGRVVLGLPTWVDTVVVVDDASHDDTLRVARESGGARLCAVRHARNRGVGAAIVTGYLEALARDADVLAVMAGDDQMDPKDLEGVVAPVALGVADYVKGNRFVHPARRNMPVARRVAGKALSLLTRLATGLEVDDTQCGYTALSAEAARQLPLVALWPRYGYPNDLLGLIAAHGLSVTEVPVRPVYAGERSGIRPWHALVVVGVVVKRRVLSPPRRRVRRGGQLHPVA
jgi:glycosyltransferase involved in cell wall biosynthesis